MIEETAEVPLAQRRPPMRFLVISSAAKRSREICPAIVQSISLIPRFLHYPMLRIVPVEMTSGLITMLVAFLFLWDSAAE
jgi:hypothetical protein